MANAANVAVLLECAGLRARGRGRGVRRVQTGRHRQRAARGTPLSRWSCRAMLEHRRRAAGKGTSLSHRSCVRAWLVRSCVVTRVPTMRAWDEPDRRR